MTTNSSDSDQTTKNDDTPENLTVGEVFGLTATEKTPEDAEYQVPIYQRNFAWEAEQIEQFIDDIWDASRASESSENCGQMEAESGSAESLPRCTDQARESYFIGNLIVQKKPGRYSEPQIYEVVDGQQRLTTLYLILAAIQPEGELPNSWKSRLRYEARTKAEIALRNIRENGAATGGKLEQRVWDDEGIIDGFNLVRQSLNNKLGDEQPSFLHYLLHHVLLVRIPLAAGTDLNRYFEIMNTRGEQLQQIDIVKARLMSKLDSEDSSTFALIWDACSDMDRYIQMTLTSGDTTLRKNVFGPSWSELKVDNFDDIKKELKARVESRCNEQADENDDESDRSLRAVMKRYRKPSPAAAEREEDDSQFKSIIDFAPFLMHVLALHPQNESADQESSLDDKKLIKVFTDKLDKVDTNEGEVTRNKQEEWVKEFAITLLRARFLFDSHILKRQYTATNTEDGDWSLLRLEMGSSEPRASAVYVAAFSDNENGDELDDDNGEASADTSAKKAKISEQRRILLLQSMLRVTYTSPRTMTWITEVLKAATAVVNKPLDPASHIELLENFARRRVQETFGRYEPKPQGFNISRIVFTYLDYLMLGDEYDPSFRFTFRNSIEHFYPQRPDEEQSGIPVVDELHLLGNLALVNVRTNSRFGNSSPKTKTEEYRDLVQTQGPKLRKMAETAAGSGWGPEQIRMHHNECLRLLTHGNSNGDRN